MRLRPQRAIPQLLAVQVHLVSKEDCHRNEYRERYAAEHYRRANIRGGVSGYASIGANIERVLDCTVQ